LNSDGVDITSALTRTETDNGLTGTITFCGFPEGSQVYSSRIVTLDQWKNKQEFSRTFSVECGPATCESVSPPPSQIEAGDLDVEVTIKGIGTHFEQGQTEVSFICEGGKQLEVGSVTVISETELMAVVSNSATCPPDNTIEVECSATAATPTHTENLPDANCNGIAEGSCEEGECVNAALCNDDTPAGPPETRLTAVVSNSGEFSSETEEFTQTDSARYARKIAVNIASLSQENTPGEGDDDDDDTSACPPDNTIEVECSATATATSPTHTENLPDANCNGIAEGSCKEGECVNAALCNDNNGSADECITRVTTGDEVIECPDLQREEVSCEFDPASVQGSSDYMVTITVPAGDFDDNTQVSFGCDAVTVESVTAESATQLSVFISVTAPDQTTTCDVEIDDLACIDSFTVEPGDCSLKKIRPDKGRSGLFLPRIYLITITGSDGDSFSRSSEVSFGTTSIKARPLFAFGNRLTSIVSVSPKTEPNTYDVTVDGSCGVQFTVE
jgi:hypothetical protein